MSYLLAALKGYKQLKRAKSSLFEVCKDCRDLYKVVEVDSYSFDPLVKYSHKNLFGTQSSLNTQMGLLACPALASATPMTRRNCIWHSVIVRDESCVKPKLALLQRCVEGKSFRCKGGHMKAALFENKIGIKSSIASTV